LLQGCQIAVIRWVGRDASFDAKYAFTRKWQPVAYDYIQDMVLEQCSVGKGVLGILKKLLDRCGNVFLEVFLIGNAVRPDR
jgi:hypothetical protein